MTGLLINYWYEALEYRECIEVFMLPYTQIPMIVLFVIGVPLKSLLSFCKESNSLFIESRECSSPQSKRRRLHQSHPCPAICHSGLHFFPPLLKITEQHIQKWWQRRALKFPCLLWEKSWIERKPKLIISHWLGCEKEKNASGWGFIWTVVCGLYVWNDFTNLRLVLLWDENSQHQNSS